MTRREAREALRVNPGSTTVREAESAADKVAPTGPPEARQAAVVAAAAVFTVQLAPAAVTPARSRADKAAPVAPEAWFPTGPTPSSRAAAGAAAAGMA